MSDSDITTINTTNFSSESHSSIRVKRFDATLPLPAYQTSGSVGMDLVAREEVMIPARGVAKVPLNVAIELPHGSWALLAARSSLHKKGLMLANSIGIVDSDYCGDNDEYLAALYNFSDQDVVVARGERIVQFVVLSHVRCAVEEVASLGSKDRGGFGSTGAR